MNEEDYIKATHDSYGTDPTLWNGQNPKCELCNEDALPFDEYCEEHQRCYYCGEREECEEEGKNCIEHPDEKAIKAVDITINQIINKTKNKNNEQKK